MTNEDEGVDGPGTRVIGWHRRGVGTQMGTGYHGGYSFSTGCVAGSLLRFLDYFLKIVIVPSVCPVTCYHSLPG